MYTRYFLKCICLLLCICEEIVGLHGCLDNFFLCVFLSFLKKNFQKSALILHLFIEKKKEKMFVVVVFVLVAVAVGLVCPEGHKEIIDLVCVPSKKRKRVIFLKFLCFFHIFLYFFKFLSGGQKTEERQRVSYKLEMCRSVVRVFVDTFRRNFRMCS